MVFQYPFQKGEQVGLFVVSLLCIIVDTIIVGLRLFAARRAQRSFDWSDAAVVAAWLCTIALGATVMASAVVIGVGWHEVPALLYYGSLDVLKTQAQLTQAVTELWAASVFFAKLSLLAVFNRYFEVRYVRIGVKACTVFVVLLFLAMIITGEVDCLPFDTKWNVADIEGWCGRAQRQFFVTSSSLHAFSDIFILCLPIPCIWSLSLPLRKKIALVGLFSGGLVTAVVSIIRIWSLSGGDWADLLYAEWVPMLLSIMEPSMGICLACLPFLRPLFNSDARSRAGSRATRVSKEQKSAGRSTEVQVTKETIVTHDDMEGADDGVARPQMAWTGSSTHHLP